MVFSYVKPKRELGKLIQDYELHFGAALKQLYEQDYYNIVKRYIFDDLILKCQCEFLVSALTDEMREPTKQNFENQQFFFKLVKNFIIDAMTNTFSFMICDRETERQLRGKVAKLVDIAVADLLNQDYQEDKSYVCSFKLGGEYMRYVNEQSVDLGVQCIKRNITLGLMQVGN
ncbi:hypothetical protein [Vibrio campbellii]|uniref:hypothetical protein n=1 Tax=Vibrio campbellii TaxID=680 RepID=UPI000CD34115|nr:hypothetical protein [Vibrio campbellii]AUW07412.1 hypothetical protein C1N51_27545 [Vibrio campbellii]